MNQRFDRIRRLRLGINAACRDNCSPIHTVRRDSHLVRGGEALAGAHLHGHKGNAIQLVDITQHQHDGKIGGRRHFNRRAPTPFGITSTNAVNQICRIEEPIFNVFGCGINGSTHSYVNGIVRDSDRLGRLHHRSGLCRGLCVVLSVGYCVSLAVGYCVSLAVGDSVGFIVGDSISDTVGLADSGLSGGRISRLGGLSTSHCNEHDSQHEKRDK